MPSAVKGTIAIPMPDQQLLIDDAEKNLFGDWQGAGT
jgi:hypothetical protein